MRFANTLPCFLLTITTATASANEWDARKEANRKIKDPWVRGIIEHHLSETKRHMPQALRPKDQALDPEFDDSIPTKKPLKECIKPGNVIDDQVFRCMKGG